MDGRAELLHQAEVVAVVPELHDLSVGEPEDVDRGEAHRATGRLDARPRAEVSPGSGPAPDHEVSVREQKVDLPGEVREGRPERLRNLLLALRPGRRLALAKVVSFVPVGEELVRDVEVALRPDLVVEAPHKRLVRLLAHSKSR